MPKTKQQHLDGTNGPKRILALDGGGIRGILTLEYLEVIESEFRRRFNSPDFLLCDYFDLIGGTSTGSIIAAGLACGMTVEQLKKPGSGRMFSRPSSGGSVVGAIVQIRIIAGSARRATRGRYNARQ
jgi:hypothetical protein